MHDAERVSLCTRGAMHGIEGEGHTPRNEAGELRGYRAFLRFGAPKQPIKVDAIDVLHREVWLDPNHTRTKYTHDITVPHRLVELSFPLEGIEIARFRNRPQHPLDNEARRWLLTEFGTGQEDFRAPAHRDAPLQEERAKRNRLRSAGSFAWHPCIMALMRGPPQAAPNAPPTNRRFPGARRCGGNRQRSCRGSVVLGELQ